MTSKNDLPRSLEHLAGAMRGALQDGGAADMRITSEDARDIQHAAEIIRLYRMARPAGETSTDDEIAQKGVIYALVKMRLSDYGVFQNESVSRAIATDIMNHLRSAHETEPKPVAWRRLINSPYEKHPRYGYSEEEFKGGEPLYTRPAEKTGEAK